MTFTAHDPDGDELRLEYTPDGVYVTVSQEDTTATAGPLQLPEHEALNAAARAALTGLADRHEDDAAQPGTPEPIRQGLRLMAQETRNYRDHHHP